MLNWFSCRTPKAEETRSTPTPSAMSEKRDLEQRFAASSFGQELPAYTEASYVEDDTRTTCVSQDREDKR